MLNSIREILRGAWDLAAPSQDNVLRDDMGRKILEKTPEGYWVEGRDDGHRVYVEACRPPGAF